MTFTSLDANGREGPNNTSGYKGSQLEGKVQLVAGIQIWSVPVTGLYSITAWGASGGNGTGANPRLGGRGAKIKGHFKLNAGEKLKILVGQKGKCPSRPPQDSPGGGGGGTFVAKGNGSPLVVAGGGGGGAKFESFNTSLNGDIEIPSRRSISFQCDLYIKQHKLYKTCGLFVIYKNTRLLQYFHTECTKNICI